MIIVRENKFLVFDFVFFALCLKRKSIGRALCHARLKNKPKIFVVIFPEILSNSFCGMDSSL